MESFNFELNQVIARTLAEGGFASEKEATREISLMVALAKISRYERECAKFRKKYGLTFQEFQRKVNSIVGAEVFEEENDLMDWEFAENALALWQKRLEVLKNAYR
ncbi:hypothetical protein V3F56_06025 [Moorellaceae bacterium AZ2]|mgnify:CR=1 FL=1|jgi:hypothetical protein|uniref:hypothetical protein n=1 Tax=Neomoorella sulfitireducens TaxID=2972948 RepID=UPI0021AC97A9|nr:hypothetical protein [Moorella sulfitireducens]